MLPNINSYRLVAKEEAIVAPEIIQNDQEISIVDFKKLYSDTKGAESEGKSKLGEKAGSNFLYIDWRSKWPLDLLQILADKYILPPEVKGIAIGFLDEGNDVLKKFLVKSIKHDLSFLWINYVALDKYESQYRLGMDEYLDSIVYAIPKAKEWVGLNYFRIESHQISKIMQAAHAVKEKVDFDKSSLKPEDDLDFGPHEYSIQKICMEDSFIKCK